MLNQKLATILAEKPVFYVSRDRERAEGLSDSADYQIITGDPTKPPESTLRLLESAVNQTAIKTAGGSVVVFKNTLPIERVCSEARIPLLNPSAELAEQAEGKVSQLEWCPELSDYLPSHEVMTLSEYRSFGEPVVIQFNRAHSGEGTYLIGDDDELGNLTAKFPDRPVRISKFIEGPVFTSNNVVTKNKILVGNISLQITGDPELTDNPMATVGNDWTATHELLSETDHAKYREITEFVGSKLRKSGWKGLFGVDIIRDANDGSMYLLDLNARQPASTTFESQLQKESDPNGLSIFEAHLLALLDSDIDQELTVIESGKRTINRKHA